jgi:hypothetical protein
MRKRLTPKQIDKLTEAIQAKDLKRGDLVERYEIGMHSNCKANVFWEVVNVKVKIDANYNRTYRVVLRAYLKDDAPLRKGFGNCEDPWNYTYYLDYNPEDAIRIRKREEEFPVGFSCQYPG